MNAPSGNLTKNTGQGIPGPAEVALSGLKFAVHLLDFGAAVAGFAF